ncbi:class I SAM-dependent methyltransferase [Nocardia sp. NBC_00511]|uniref:class I SAM-dependent methyltransferase n=1 Tax=Nocardia sp. NBC_00511 TaxID=2903591 RepID=UPI0030E51A7A
MVTLPPDPPASTEPAPHLHRQMAESFGVNAERYDRTRQPYPADLITRVLANAPGAEVLDVGCGTGIAARQFRAAGATVLGVEPDARMAEFARSTGIAVEPGTFEDWDPRDRQFDAIIAATSWHWVDPVAGAAKARHLLRPNGRIALFWHIAQPPPSVNDAFTAACREVIPDQPIPNQPSRDIYRPILAKPAESLRAAGGFTAPEEWLFDWERTYTREEWLDQVPTQGIFTRLDPQTLSRILDPLGAAIDALGGTFTMTYTTAAVTAVRDTTEPEQP